MADLEDFDFKAFVVDGGHQVCHECSPVRDGEDALFGIHSLDDLALHGGPHARLRRGADHGCRPERTLRGPRASP
ncbi:DUF6892 domain-containing protein [Streptomyces sp. NPDC057428]|uniref:DUF6892 domain-containing protein n=1 Tax=Streptomyces sp. NPDC057428 TaxID=3346129 RepID=UPI0036C87760